MIKKRGKSSVKGGDRITLLRDSDGDGRTDLQTTFIDGLDAPYGLAFVDNTIYVANQDNLVSFPYTEGATQITTPATEVTKLPAKINHHWTKAMTASPDGSKLYVGIGSNSNVGERGMAVEEDRAVIWEIDRETGLPAESTPRACAIPRRSTFHPSTGQLWTVVNERDELGPQLVPDYLTSVREGAFYGWPYSYYGQNVDPRIRPQRPDLVAKAIAPDYALGFARCRSRPRFRGRRRTWRTLHGRRLRRSARQLEPERPFGIQSRFRSLPERPSVGQAGRSCDGLPQGWPRARPPRRRSLRPATSRTLCRGRCLQHSLAYQP